MQRELALGLIAVFNLYSCGSHSKSESGSPKPTPQAAVELAKEMKSSCIFCGGGGYTYDANKCETGESCIGVTISVSGAPVTSASCRLRFEDSNGSGHSYSCRRK